MMTEAALSALALTVISGWTPKGLHRDTWFSVMTWLDTVTEIESPAMYRIKPGAPWEWRETAVYVFHQRLIADGWRFDRHLGRHRNRLRYVRGWEYATLNRVGDCFFSSVPGAPTPTSATDGEPVTVQSSTRAPGFAIPPRPDEETRT